MIVSISFRFLLLDLKIRIPTQISMRTTRPATELPTMIAILEPCWFRSLLDVVEVSVGVVAVESVVGVDGPTTAIVVDEGSGDEVMLVVVTVMVCEAAGEAAGEVAGCVVVDLGTLVVRAPPYEVKSTV